jgi:hypothetical protein
MDRRPHSSTMSRSHSRGHALRYRPPFSSEDVLVKPHSNQQSPREWSIRMADTPANENPDYIPWRPDTRRRIIRVRRPFTPWAVISERHPTHLEVRRFMALPPGKREDFWFRRRRHAPLDDRLPEEWQLDAIYLRHREERQYCERLRRLTVDPTVAQISLTLVCLVPPWVPYRWPEPPYPPEVTFRNFPPGGDVADPHGSDISLDSAWRLREASVAGGTGEPGRLLQETKTEHRLACRTAFLVPYHQVEFHVQNAEARVALYVPCPLWWDEAWVSRHMFVPLPPLVTYRGSRLLMSEVDSPSWRFWWLVFESEWTVLLFSRWCADLTQRQLMWRLPARARENISRLGLEGLLVSSPYSCEEARSWLNEHDSHEWASSRMQYQLSGPNRENPEGVHQEVVKFVRVYPIIPTPLLDQTTLSESPQQAPQLPPDSPGESDEIVASGSVVPLPPASVQARPPRSIFVSSRSPTPVPSSPRIPRRVVAVPPPTSMFIPRITSAFARGNSSVAATPPTLGERSTLVGRSVTQGVNQPSSMLISSTLSSRLQEAGLAKVIQHYARPLRRGGYDGWNLVDEPVSEEALVDTIVRLHADMVRSSEAVRSAKAQNESVRSELARSEVIGKLLLDRVTQLECRSEYGGPSPSGKRPRDQ